MNPEQHKSEMDLLAKYLAGEANAEEAMQVDEWLQHEANRKSFDQLVKVWNHLPHAPSMQTPPADKMWDAISEGRAAKPATRVKKLSIYRMVAAAAVVGVIAVLSFLWTRNAEQGSGSDSPVYVTKTADGGVNIHTLSDGSVITINKGSSVAYEDAFNTSDREVILKGEAYFDVHPNKEKPFIIHVENLDIKVIGTSFNVRSLPDAQRIEVQVQSGVVEMSTKHTDMLVHKGETGVFDQQVGSLSVTNELDVNSLSYATKTFSFNDIPFTDACEYLEDAFDIAIEVDESKFRDCRLTAHFENQPLPYILEVINATLNTTSSREGNTIYIKGNGCR